MDNTLSQIVAYLEETRNLDFSGNRDSMLERRITTRLFPTASKSFSDYHTYIKAHPEELDNLIQVLTINVSWFFREPLTFEVLSQILKEMILKKIESGDRWMRIWSAGCATGEEPYSVAMIIKDIMLREEEDFRFNIFASDIDEDALGIAKKGVYSGEAVKNVKQGQIASYFLPLGNEFIIDSSIRKMVNFSFHDLLDKKSVSPPDSVFGNFDLILCRNVLIYFYPGYQTKIFKKLHNSLNQDGYLVLGESEVPTGEYQADFVRENPCCKIFRKYC
jgi:chemotaxis protein methyltransferase CheR